MAKKNKGKKKSGGIKKLIRQAGPNISKKEMKQITKAAGGNVRKAVNRIAAVQQSQRQADKTPTRVGSSAANLLIRRATKAPQARYDPKGTFGTSKLGQSLQSRVGTPGLAGPRNPQSGAARYNVSGTEMQKVPGGMAIKAGGGLSVKRRPTRTTPQITPDPTDSGGGGDDGKTDGTEIVPNPNQGLIDQINTLTTTLADRDTYFQDQFNTMQLDYDQRMADLATMFNTQIAEQENMYQMQIAAAAEQARQEQEAARAFMINQGRMMSPANLQIGATYGTPKLAGTQGFKSPSRQTTMATPANVATAFTAPTLAAAATQPVQTPVLNV